MGKVLECLGGGLLSHNEHERDTMLCAMWLGTSETVDRSTRGVPRDEGSCVGKHHPAVFRRSWGTAPFQTCLWTLCISRILLRHGCAMPGLADHEHPKDEIGTTAS